MSKQRAPALVETPLVRTVFNKAALQIPTSMALCDDGAAWVGFAGAWIDLIGMDGAVRQRVPTSAPAIALAARPDGGVSALCHARRDIWGRRMTTAQLFDLRRDGTQGATTSIALGAYAAELVVDATGQTYVSSGVPLYSVTDGVAASILPYWVTRVRVVPSTNQLWVQTSYYLSRVAELGAVARSAVRGPAPGINTITPTHQFSAYAPRSDGQAWLAALELKSVDRSVIRRMDLGTIDYTRPRPPLAEQKIAADIYDLAAAKDDGFFALGSDGLLRRADATGEWLYELRLATAVSTRMESRLRVKKLVLSRNERFAAGIDVIDGALHRVALPAR